MFLNFIISQILSSLNQNLLYAIYIFHEAVWIGIDVKVSSILTRDILLLQLELSDPCNPLELYLDII